MSLRIGFFCMVIGLMFPAARAADRLSSYGSNPLLSQELFPQDITALNSNKLIIFPSYEKLPYWGDIDQPENKPDANYTSTGIDIANGDAAFRYTDKIFSLDNRFGYLHNFQSGPVPTASLDLDWDVDSRYSHAEGSLTNGGGKIPFDYSMVHALNAFHLGSAAAFSAFGVPAGLRIAGGYQNTLLLTHHLEFTKSNTEYSSKRALWGWSTSGCAHIFGSHEAEGDAWLQDGYVKGPIYDFSIQSGATLPLGKLGMEFGYRAGHQDYYRWRTDSSSYTGDATVNQNFVGGYQKGDWSGTTSDLRTKLYGNIAIKSSPRYSLNTFVAVGYNGVTNGQALSNNLEVSNNSKDKYKSVSVAAAPNISIPFIPLFSYIDFAVQASYGYSRFDNTGMRYIGGGQIETWRDSETGAADENVWQPYSYANRNVMNAGIDLSAMFPLVNNDLHRVGFGLQLLINTKFMYMTKYYGKNETVGSDFDFKVSRLRKDFEREIQFATGVKAQYQRGPYLAWLEVTEPLLRSLLPRTRVYDAGVKQPRYEHEKSPLWMSMEGLQVGVYLARDWTMPWLRNR